MGEKMGNNRSTDIDNKMSGFHYTSFSSLNSVCES